MTATVKEKAKEWGCSQTTVRDYCTSGIIPPAEKKGRPPKWEIPDAWPKPPIGRHGLCYLLDTVCQINNGAAYSSITWGYKTDVIRQGYDYLISSAFMSTIDTGNLESTIAEATVTPRGMSLIERENREGKSKIKFRAYTSFKADFGLASLEAGGEVANG